MTPRGLRPTGAAPAYARAARAVKDDLHRTLTFRLSWPPHAAYGFTERLRPSHANRCQELRRKAMQEEYSSLPSGAGLRPKIRRFIQRRCAGPHEADSSGKVQFRRQAQKKKEELAGPDPTPIERTLADQAVVCEFDLYYCHICVSEADILGQRATATLYDRRRQRAHKRLMSALKTLATVRRIAIPKDTSKRHFKQKHSYRLLMCYNP